MVKNTAHARELHTAQVGAAYIITGAEKKLHKTMLQLSGAPLTEEEQQ